MPLVPPSQEVPILHIHSAPDTQVPLLGGIGTGPSGAYMPPNDSIINVWRLNNSCTGTLDTIYNQSGTVGLKWTDCLNCSELFVYVTSDGGHSWPGGNQTTNGDVPSLQLNATDLIWSFFQNHSLNCNPLSIHEIESDMNISIFPNPASNLITIRSKEEILTEKNIKIFSIEGKLMLETASQTIDISNFNNGVYFVQIPLNTSSVVKRVIKY